MPTHMQVAMAGLGQVTGGTGLSTPGSTEESFWTSGIITNSIRDIDYNTTTGGYVGIDFDVTALSNAPIDATATADLDIVFKRSGTSSFQITLAGNSSTFGEFTSIQQILEPSTNLSSTATAYYNNNLPQDVSTTVTGLKIERRNVTQGTTGNPTTPIYSTSTSYGVWKTASADGDNITLGFGQVLAETGTGTKTANFDAIYTFYGRVSRGGVTKEKKLKEIRIQINSSCEAS